MNRIKFTVIFVLALFQGLFAQQKPEVKPVPDDYDRREEMIYDGKRYRIHNNYVTFGPGLMRSSIRGGSQQSLNLDFQFHIRRQHFQGGVMMSGESLGSNNHVGGRLGYGYRMESRANNFAFFGGPTYFTGVRAIEDSLGVRPLIYKGFGVYGCAQAVYKLSFDIGLGVELYGEISLGQRVGGIRLIAFFSGAYRGPKRNFNPHVRSENPKK